MFISDEVIDRSCRCLKDMSFLSLEFFFERDAAKRRNTIWRAAAAGDSKTRDMHLGIPSLATSN